jgi:hypothetical protein
MSKPSKEYNDASLIAMENRLFDHFIDAMQDQYQAMYAFMDHICPHSNAPTIQETPDGDKISSNPPHSNEPTIQESHHLSNSCDKTQSLHNSLIDTISTPPHLNGPTIQETPYSDDISRTPPHSNKPTIQESPDGDEICITPSYSNELPIQENPDSNKIATSSE